MSQAELMALPQPAMANILRYMVGEWGAAFINIGLIISIIGCWLSWTMLPVETTLLMSRDGMLPKSWGQGQSKTSTKLFIVYHCCIDERVLVNVPCDRLRVSICLFDVYRSDFDLLLARGDLSNDLFLSAKRQ